MLMLGLLLLGSGWNLRGFGGVATETTVDASALFVPATPSWSGATVRTRPEDLAWVARSTLVYMDLQAGVDDAVGPGLFAELGVDLERVEQTLDFVVQVAEADRGKPAQRLQDPDFIARSFELYRWQPDLVAAAQRKVTVEPDKIRLTRYLVYQVEGRTAPEGEFKHALYSDPGEAGRDITRQAAMAGALDGKARPLVWLTEKGVYDALMQGTIEVATPGASPRLFNVSVNNGIPYDPAVKDPALQQRYWFFDEVDAIRGWGKEPEHRIQVRPGTTVAGDVFNLGLGKLVALEMDGDLRLAVLADTGGAFQPNLFQLDWLAGSYPSYFAFQQATADIPPRVGAGVLLVRKEALDAL